MSTTDRTDNPGGGPADHLVVVLSNLAFNHFSKTDEPAAAEH